MSDIPASSEFRTQLRIHCHGCDTKYIVKTERMICPGCGRGADYHCFQCGKDFNVKDTVMCQECHWFICPHCGSHRCQTELELVKLKEEVQFLREDNRDMELQLARYGLQRPHREIKTLGDILK